MLGRTCFGHAFCGLDFWVGVWFEVVDVPVPVVAETPIFFAGFVSESVPFGKEGVRIGGFAFEGFPEGFGVGREGFVEEEVGSGTECKKFCDPCAEKGLDAWEVDVGVGFVEGVGSGVPGLLIDELEGEKLFDLEERIVAIEPKQVLFGHARCNFELPPAFGVR